jgi:hypothetical protein
MSVIFICEHCSTIFSPSRTGQIRRFCSVTCYKASNTRKTFNCLQCNRVTFCPKFCSPSCRATYCNHARGPRSQKTKYAISATRRIRKPRRFNWKDNICGPYTTVYKNVCCKTGKIFYDKTWKKYHPSLIADRHHYAMLCQFKFSISQFPFWFDGKIIQDHGWYSTPGSRKGVKNINGVSRDHKVSVDYGYHHGIDPQYISHPANCQLVLHNENQRKHKKCSITIEQLMKDIAAFDTALASWQK